MNISEHDVIELDIQTVHKISLERLVTNQALSGGNLMWCGDVLISWSGYTGTDHLIHEQVAGKYKWVLLEYTYEMEKYQATINAEKLNREVPIFDMSENPFYQEVAQYLKSKQDK